MYHQNNFFLILLHLLGFGDFEQVLVCWNIHMLSLTFMFRKIACDYWILLIDVTPTSSPAPSFKFLTQERIITPSSPAPCHFCNFIWTVSAWSQFFFVWFVGMLKDATNIVDLVFQAMKHDILSVLRPTSLVLEWITILLPEAISMFETTLKRFEKMYRKFIEVGPNIL